MTALAGLALASALALTGCSGAASQAGGSDDKFTVAAFTAGYGTPVGKATLDAFVEKGKSLGWDVKTYTSEFDYDKINTDVNGAITQGVDAILAGFPDPRQISPLVNAAKDAN
ncbi:MAG TPA: hypothetical protein VNQ33_12955, partial [Acidimicrobiales bacterium]|nr:hypothetical protein [Acidimicrobiales bacterium]